MKRSSFQARLFVSFLLGALIPLLLCAAALLQTFRVRMDSDAGQEAQQSLAAAAQALSQADGSFQRAHAALDGDKVVAAALRGDKTRQQQLYAQLYAAAQPLRDYARLDLYNLEGQWKFSTHAAPVQTSLPTSWGVLRSAKDGPSYTAALDVTDSSQSVLRCASLLTDDKGRPAGYLVMGLTGQNLRHLLDNTYQAPNDLLILTRHWRPVYCAQPSLAAALAPRLRAQLLHGQPLGDPEFFYRADYHSPTGLYLILRQPRVFTKATMNMLYTVSAGCALICILLAVLLSLRFSRSLSQPVLRLTQGMDRVEAGDWTVQVPVRGADELAQLTGQFNGMVTALARNQTELLERQKEVDQAQIRMLQAQLNPHFLCNTLDTMKWVGKINKVPEVAELSTNLADILRFCISPQEFVPLGQEAEILRRYMDIQKIRLAGEVTFKLELPPRLETALVPKMMLQPLVENAVLHGLSGVKDGAVTVAAAQEGEALVITVSDTGRGFPEGLLGPYSAQAAPEAHLGLYNVDTILRKNYGGPFGLTLENSPQGGAVVTARLPIQKEERPC